MTNLSCERPVMRRVYLIYYLRRLSRSEVTRVSLTLGVVALLAGVVSFDHVWANLQNVENWSGRGQYLFQALLHTKLMIQGLLLILTLLAYGRFLRLLGGAKALVNFF